MSLIRATSRFCYYCGEKATTNEHVPPKQMFKAFSCDSITVPSCELHNTSRSLIDQTVMNGFMVPLDEQINNPANTIAFSADVRQAIQVARPSFNQTVRTVVKNPLVKDLPQVLSDLPNVAFLPDTDVISWVRFLTAGLIRHGIRGFDESMPWLNADIWSPDHFRIPSVDAQDYKMLRQTMSFNEEKRNKLENLQWELGWSAYPRPYPASIYHFMLHLDEREDVIIFKHKFYDQYTWYVRISSHIETMTRISNKLSKG